MTEQNRPGPTVFVLYGATGDLAKRMVLPAFYTLAKEKLLPSDWVLVGNGRGDVSHLDFRKHVRGVLTDSGEKLDDGTWSDFESRLRFAGGGFAKDDPGSLLDVIAEAREQVGADAQLVHYLAIPPSAFQRITEGLGEHDLAKGSYVVYEKPFGTSAKGFRELDEMVHEVLDEKQVFRIDHFLGKEATQNLHVLRFANGLFDAVWSREHIRAVQIDVPETLGIADRAEFYDETGAVLDMLVTHLFQLAAEVAMEPPADLSAENLQAAREKVIGCFRPLDTDDVVLGQFEGFTDTDGVRSTSRTDTFVAAKLFIDNDRWRDVPFLLRTGKRLHTSAQRVSLILREPAGTLSGVPKHGNVITFDLKGDGAIDLQLVTKRPGPGAELETADTSLHLDQLPDGDPLPPYARLIHDILTGDRSLFTRPDGLAAVWEAAAPLLDDPPTLHRYAPNSWGPKQASALAEPDGWLLGG
ncbi:glucose-6-phosphate dehydrogenase [Jatrophihabitans fulvus]